MALHVPPLPRAPEAHDLVMQSAYFVLHAPRQSGKTTFLTHLRGSSQAKERSTALYMSCEAASANGDDHIGAQETLVYTLAGEADRQLRPELRPPAAEPRSPQTGLGDFLTHWSEHSPRPVALFLDESDAVRGESLNAVLRQLRAGFANRPAYAPWSVLLCSLRDVRDYKMESGGDPNRLGTSSPCNVELESLRLGDFTDADVRDFVAQHTATTGQVFEDLSSVPIERMLAASRRSRDGRVTTRRESARSGSSAEAS